MLWSVDSWFIIVVMKFGPIPVFNYCMILGTPALLGLFSNYPPHVNCFTHAPLWIARATTCSKTEVAYIEYLHLSSIEMMNCWQHEIVTRNVQYLVVWIFCFDRCLDIIVHLTAKLKAFTDVSLRSTTWPVRVTTILWFFLIENVTNVSVTLLRVETPTSLLGETLISNSYFDKDTFKTFLC